MAIKTDKALEKFIRESKALGEKTNAPKQSIDGCTGLTVEVRVGKRKVTVSFFYQYSFDGKRPLLKLGEYPSMSLSDAKIAYHEAKALVSQGKDPKAQKANLKRQHQIDRLNTVEHFIDICRELDYSRKDTLAKSTLWQKNFYYNEVQKHFGHYQMTELTPHLIIEILKNYDSTSKRDRTKKALARVCNQAVVRGVIDRNPTFGIGIALTPHVTKHYPAITKPVLFAQLLKDINNLDDSFDHIREILQLLALTLLRVNDLCSLRWSDVDFDNAVIHFKLKKGTNRDDMLSALDVPMIPQIREIFESMHQKTGHLPYVFATDRIYTDNNKVTLTLNATRTLGKHMNGGKGYQGVHCTHGFRASGRTMIAEKWYDTPQICDILELMLGHKIKDVNGNAYNRASLFDARKHIMTKWADYLDSLIENG